MINRMRWMGCLGALALATAGATAQVATPERASAKTWIGKAAEIEDYMRTATIIRMEGLSVGVTRPRRAYLAPGGPVESIAWKRLRPGMSNGFHESYKSEIAAYELDKLLELNMVPPKVEKRVENEVGVAIMWVTPTMNFRDLGGVPKVPPVHQASWNEQLVRAKMFHNLIGDIDPNLGNWLVDPAWNLILIDHSRALTTTKTLVHEMQGLDAELWARMTALTEATLTTAIGEWLDQAGIRAILDRRAKMQTELEKQTRRRP